MSTPLGSPTTDKHVLGISQHYRQLGLLLTLYLAQGLPAGFITQALPAILRQYQASLVAIGWSGLILLPWGLKFLWSPWVDAHYQPRWGRSRSWIVPLQLGSMLLLAIVAWFEPTNLSNSSSIVMLFALLFVLSLMGATHDVATDGLATRLLKTPILTADPVASDAALMPPRAVDEQASTHRQSQGNAVQAIGYRLGLIIGGGVLLMSLDQLGWRLSFLAMAGLVLMNTLPIVRFQEALVLPAPRTSTAAKPTDRHRLIPVVIDYLLTHYQYFWSSRELRAWLGVLLTFKVADGLSSGMVKPMMVDLGVDLSAMGFWVTIGGSLASLLGAAAATVLMKRLTRYQALIGFNLLQALTTGLYGAVAYGFYQGKLQHFGWLYAVNALEHFCASLALIAMLTTVMHYARHEKAGSDFTVQVCLLTVLGGGVHFASGYLAQWLGYPLHFTWCLVIGLVCLAPIQYWHKISNNEK